MNLTELEDLSAQLTRIANLPMLDAAGRLHLLRLHVLEKISAIRKTQRAL